MTYDPYAPPSTQVEAPNYIPVSGGELAGRGTRVKAVILDGLVYMPVALLVGAGAPFIKDGSSISPIVIGLFLVSAIWIIAVLVINLKLLAKEGQTLGKKWSKIRIVRSDGSKASFGRILGLRMIVSGLIGAIPMVGYVYSILDSLFIFTESRQCLHDKIADTKVVQA